MPRRLKIVLLLAGTVLGYGSAFCHAHHGAHHRHAMFERHVASICADAAKNPERAPAASPFDW